MMLLAGTGYKPRGKKFSLAWEKYKKRTHSGFAQWRERRGKTKTEGTTRRNNVFLLGTFFYLGNGKARRSRKIILATYSRTVIATTTRLADTFFPKFQDFPCLAPPLLLFFLSFFDFACTPERIWRFYSQTFFLKKSAYFIPRP